MPKFDIGPEFGPGGIGMEYREDKHLQDLAKKVGVTGAFREIFRDRNLAGINIGKTWYDHITKSFRNTMRYSDDKTITQEVDSYIASVIKKTLIVPAEKVPELVDAIKAGGEFAFTRPEAVKSTMLHEIMHTLTGKEAKPYGEKFKIPIAKIRELEIEAHLEFGTYPPEWIQRPHEFVTETMTQYFLGNIRPGTNLHKFAEAVLRNSDDPQIKALIGTTVGLALMVKSAERKKK